MIMWAANVQFLSYIVANLQYRPLPYVCTCPQAQRVPVPIIGTGSGNNKHNCETVIT